MVENRPLYLLPCLIWAPLRLRRRYHADPLLTVASFIVYTCQPTANQAVASSLADQDQPTHHTIWWWRIDLYTSCLASSGHLFDYGVAVTLIFVLIPTLPRTSTTYLLLGKITSKIYVSQFLVPVQYFPLTNFLPWCKASNF